MGNREMFERKLLDKDAEESESEVAERETWIR
jgi:hypothetical protein